MTGKPVCLRVVFTRSPVPLNRRLTIAPVTRGMKGYENFYSTKRKTGYEMVLTKEYREWLREQVRVLTYTKRQQGLSTINTPCVCLAVWSRPDDKRSHDVDGVLKGPFDALTEAQIIKDDNLICAAQIVTVPPQGKGSMSLLILQLTDNTTRGQVQALNWLFEQEMTAEHGA